jgi:hypothetical protein
MKDPDVCRGHEMLTASASTMGLEGSVMAPEHAVIVTYSLSDSAFGSPHERDAVRTLQQRLTAAIESSGVGEFDGNEFGGGRVALYAYGSDADRLFSVMEPLLRDFPARPAYAVLRYGSADDSMAIEHRVDL